MNENQKAIALTTKLVMEHNDITLDDAIKKVSELVILSEEFVKSIWEDYFLTK